MAALTELYGRAIGAATTPESYCSILMPRSFTSFDYFALSMNANSAGGIELGLRAHDIANLGMCSKHSGVPTWRIAPRIAKI